MLLSTFSWLFIFVSFCAYFLKYLLEGYSKVTRRLLEGLIFSIYDHLRSFYSGALFWGAQVNTTILVSTIA